MPYIGPATRKAIDSGGEPAYPGELNYLVTRIIHDYLGPRPNYTRYNEVIGVLECAKLELYRRKVVPYEDEKIKENGDV